MSVKTKKNKKLAILYVKNNRSFLNDLLVSKTRCPHFENIFFMYFYLLYLHTVWFDPNVKRKILNLICAQFLKRVVRCVGMVLSISGGVCRD